MDFPKFKELYTKALSNNYVINDEMRLTISVLSKQHIENIYLIILHYAILENLRTTHNLEESLNNFYPSSQNKKIFVPYNGNSSGKGILYNLDNLPKHLESIIANYIKEITY